MRGSALFAVGRHAAPRLAPRALPAPARARGAAPRTAGRSRLAGGGVLTRAEQQQRAAPAAAAAAASPEWLHALLPGADATTVLRRDPGCGAARAATRESLRR
jgi:hypothetical protein